MFERFRNIFRKASSVFQVGISGMSNPIWPERNYDVFASEAYKKNLTAFRSIDKIAKACAGVTWRVYKKQNNVEDQREVADPNNDVALTLHRPSPMQSTYWFIYAAISFFILTGNAFIQRIVVGGRVREFHVLRSSWMKILTSDSGTVIGYSYRSGTQYEKVYEVDPITGESDILHIKTFNPLDDIWGMAVVEPAAREIDTNNAAVDWHKSLLDNQARPGLLLMYERSLTDEQRKQLKKDLKERKEGPKAAGSTLVLENARDAKPFGFTPTDMDFVEGNREKERAIARGFGVPAQVLGITGDQTFANFAEARAYFMEDTVIDYLSMLKSAFNAWLFPDGQYEIDVDLTGIPALASRISEMWKRANDANFVSYNEKRKMVGLPKAEGGDIIFVPAAMIPLVEAGIPIDENAAGKNFDEDSDYTDDEEIPEGKPYANEHACRLKDPSEFTSFRRQNNAAQISGKRVDFIYGIKDGKTTLQAIRYPKKIWSAESARSDCMGRKPIKFEESE